MDRKMLTSEGFEEIRRWIYRNARPLDLARWQYHFEGGPAEAVLTALAAYQNEDGGFGHALEADCWNPYSAPIQTADAVLLLDELGFEEGEHPVLQGILRWLESGEHCEGGYWRNTVPQNDAYPHAPWWNYTAEEGPVSFNPTGILVGFLLRYAHRSSAVYQQALETAAKLLKNCACAAPVEQHDLSCCFFLIKAVQRAGLGEALGAEEALRAAVSRAGALIERDQSSWGSYVCLPSVFIDSPQSPLYPGNEEILGQELAMLIDRREPGGVWAISWRWNGYPEAFAVSENWWKGRCAVNNLRLLRNFGLLER